jgi:hypothetical protein
MDQVAKGMTEAGRRADGLPPRTEQPSEKLTDKAKDVAKSAVKMAGDVLKTTGQKLKEVAD